MIIESLIIRNLRNHKNSEINFNKNINIIHGLNGSGKTTILEAISIASLSKTFLPVPDSSIVRQEANSYEIILISKNDLDIPYKINISYTSGQKKQINSTIGNNLLPKDIIGEIPLVILTPDFKSITFGTPQDRRDFLDRLLSQSSKIYLEELIKYKRILKQRNSLLGTAKQTRNYDYSSIEPWTEQLIGCGSEIAYRRKLLVEEFQPHFKNIYRLVSEDREEVSLDYIINGNKSKSFVEKKDITEYYINSYNELKSDELKRGTTLFGPQKDELKFIINSGIAKEIASQGQHKSLLISIKFAEFEYLKRKKNETPIILLDDIFSELDKIRTSKVIELLSSDNAQTFITVTEIEILGGVLSSFNNKSLFGIEAGKVSY